MAKDFGENIKRILGRRSSDSLTLQRYDIKVTLGRTLEIYLGIFLRLWDLSPGFQSSGFSRQRLFDAISAAFLETLTHCGTGGTLILLTSKPSSSFCRLSFSFLDA